MYKNKKKCIFNFLDNNKYNIDIMHGTKITRLNNRQFYS